MIFRIPAGITDDDEMVSAAEIGMNVGGGPAMAPPQVRQPGEPAPTTPPPDDSTLYAVVPDGSPKRIIVEEAETWGADLVVVGSHGYRSWERMLLGSVSQAVAAHAECSVEIVRCPKK